MLATFQALIFIKGIFFIQGWAVVGLASPKMLFYYRGAVWFFLQQLRTVKNCRRLRVTFEMLPFRAFFGLTSCRRFARYLIQAAGCKSRFVPAPMLSKCCCICFNLLYISLLCSQLHKYKLIVIYLSSENVKGLKDCFQACFSSKSYVSRLFGCLFLPPTAPNCENVQAVKGLYCPLWVCFRCCILSFGGSL